MDVNFKKMETPEEIAFFWRKKKAYEEQDIFPYLAEVGTERQEIIAWFDSVEYYNIIMDLHKRAQGGSSPLQFVTLYAPDNEYLGFLMYKIYTQEDGKAFILDFCIDQKWRNQGIGSTVFQQLVKKLTNEEGAKYFALNTSNENNRRFWQRQGFVSAGLDENEGEVYLYHPK